MIRFATALLAYRLAEIDHWYSRHGGSQDQAADVEREVYRTRATTWNAFMNSNCRPVMRSLT